MQLKSCVVIGLGLFGSSIAKTLAKKGVDVVVVDRDERLIEGIKNDIPSALCLDVTNEKAIIESGILDADLIVVAIGEDMESSILTTALLKKHGAKRIVARAISDIHAQILTLVGASRTIDPEEEMGVRLAEELYAPDVYARIHLSTGQEVIEFTSPKAFVGKTVQELKFREKYRLNIIAIKKRIQEYGESPKWQVIRLPKPDDVISEGDIIVVIGDEDAIKHFLDMIR